MDRQLIEYIKFKYGYTLRFVAHLNVIIVIFTEIHWLFCMSEEDSWEKITDEAHKSILKYKHGIEACPLCSELFRNTGARYCVGCCNFICPKCNIQIFRNEYKKIPCVLCLFAKNNMSTEKRHTIVLHNHT